MGIQYMEPGERRSNAVTAPMAVAHAPESNIQISSTAGMEVPELANELEDYLVNHTEYSTSMNMQGGLSYVRLVNHVAAR